MHLRHTLHLPATQVCFVPEVAGTYEAILSVQSSPLLASKSTSKTNVILKAKAEEAQIKVG